MARVPHIDDEDEPVVDEELIAELADAEARLRELRGIASTDYQHLREVHLAEARVWQLRADMRFAQGKDDGARKASTTAAEHASLAAKLERDSIADRVAALEDQVSRQRDLGDEMAGLD